VEYITITASLLFSKVEMNAHVQLVISVKEIIIANGIVVLLVMYTVFRHVD